MSSYRACVAALAAAVGLWVGQAVASEESTLGSMTYDAATKVLTVVFEKGGTYKYAEVPQDIYDELQKAESKGEAFNKLVRGKFAATKVTE